MTTIMENQDSLVYSTEDQLYRMLDRSFEYPTAEIFGSTVAVPQTEKKFGDLESVKRYIAWIYQTDWMKTNFPDSKPPKVELYRGHAKAEYVSWTQTIRMPAEKREGRWSMREMVVLHELAHHLADGRGHGSAFTQAEVELVTEYVGIEAGFLLRSMYLMAGVH